MVSTFAFDGALRIASLLLGGLLLVTGCDSGAGPKPARGEVHRLRNLGVVHFERNTKEGFNASADAFRKAVQASGGDRDDRINLIRALVFAGQQAGFREALDVLRAVREAYRSGSVGKADGREIPVAVEYLEGLAAMKAAKASAVSDPQLIATAIENFRSVTKRDPSCLPAWFQLGTLLLGKKEYDAAIAALDPVGKNDRGFLGAAALYRMNTAHSLAGREAESEALLKRFKDVQKTLPEGNPGEEVYQRSRYTAATLVPAARRDAEPPPVSISFNAVASWELDVAESVQVTAFDFDADGSEDWCAFAAGKPHVYRYQAPETAGGARAPTPKPTPTQGPFVDFTDLSGIGDVEDLPAVTGVAAGDIDNDGFTDLFVWGDGRPTLLLKNMGEGAFEALPESGASVDGEVADARWVDFDHDGDVDVAVLHSSPTGLRATIVRNNGDASFEWLSGKDGEDGKGAKGDANDYLPGTHAAPDRAPKGRLRLAFADFDLKNDIDLVIPGKQGAVLYRNPRHGPFVAEALVELAGQAILLAADFDNDGDPDVLGLPSPQATLRLLWNDGIRSSAGSRQPGSREGALPPLSFRRAQVTVEPALGAALDARVADIDNDGDPDVVAITVAGVQALRNDAGNAFTVVDIPTPEGFQAQRVETLDADRDGTLDLLLGGLRGKKGAVVLLRNTSTPRYHAVTLQLIGARDNRWGVGSLVSSFAGKSFQTLTHNAARTVRVGIGPEANLANIDGFRILWPNGVSQSVLPSEIKWDERGSMKVTQKAGLVVSCPFLYTFDGEEFQYLTDIVAIAPLDEWLPPGGTPHLDPEEYVRIPDSRLRAVAGPDGSRELRLVITEELKETTYLDRVELVEVRHPESVLLFGRETTAQAAIEPLRVFVVPRDRVAPAERVKSSPPAVNPTGDSGALPAELVAAPDGRYWHPYPSSPSQWTGWVPPYHVELSFPSTTPTQDAAPRALLLQGRVVWPDSDVSFALAQHGRRWQPLKVLHQSGGSWQPLVDAGFPTGMDRVMVVDLDAKKHTASGPLRLATTYPYLWDWIACATAGAWVELTEDGERTCAPAPGLQVALWRRTLPLRSAKLRYHGFSAIVGDRPRHEHSYDYENPDPGSVLGLSFDRPQGFATRHGDVKPLVTEADDRVTILVSGDAVDLAFAAPEPLEDGWTRTYFLRVTGWAKEANFHNRTGPWIAPLPRARMKRYPPDDSEKRERDASFNEYLQKYQTRWVER